MAETDNLKLALPASNEYVDVEVLNENFRKIDTSVLLALAAAAPYSTSQTYALGAYCTRGGKLYKCTTAITSAETWTVAHWTETTMGAELVAISIALANKAGWSQKNIAGSILDWALAQDEPTTAYAQSADGVTDLPKDGYWLVELVMSNTNGRWKKLVLTSITTNESWYRIYNWSVWNAAWHRQYDDTNAYSKTEVEELMKAKRNWKGGIVTGGVSILDWAASQDTPTDCACDTTVTGVPYSGYWVVQLSIFPEAGWKTLVAKCILTGEVWSIGCNVGTWDAWRKLLDSATTKPSDIGAAPAYSYGTADLTAGVSALDTGKLYFVYE